MNEKMRLFDQIPVDMKLAVTGSGEFQRLCSDFVHAHVQQNVNQVVDMVRERSQETGEYDEDLESLEAKPDYIEACEENLIQLVEADGDRHYWFDWNDLDSIMLDAEGVGYLDFAAFAKHHNLDLTVWGWDKMGDTPVLLAEVDAEEHEVDQGLSLLAAIGDATSSASDVLGALSHVARYNRQVELADQLLKAQRSGATLQKLFADFVDKQPDLSLTEFDSAEEAAKDACESHRPVIEPDAGEIYEFWAVDDRLGYLLQKQGEVVADDFLGMRVWGRSTTGQSISMDGVISRIVKEQCDDKVDDLVKQVFPHLGSTDENLRGVPIDALKALEEGRVSIYRAGGAYNRDFHVVTAAGSSGTLGWLVDDVAKGTKSSSFSDGPVAINEIKSYLQSYQAHRGHAVEDVPLTQRQIDDWVASIARHHQLNQGSPLHTVPENLEARLGKLSPAYAAAHSNSGPSLG